MKKKFIGKNIFKGNVFLVIVTYITMLYIYFRIQLDSIQFSIPDYDTNKHIIFASHYAYSLENFIWNKELAESTSVNLLTYAFLGFLSILNIKARYGFIAGYSICLLGIFYSAYAIFRDFIKSSFVLAILMLSGILFSYEGGLLDFRIDVFSVTLCIMSYSSLINKKYLNGILLFLTAALFKSSSFYLFLPIVILTVVCGKWKYRNQYKLSSILKIISIGVLGFFFIKFVFVHSLSYNLIGTGGESVPEKIRKYLLAVPLLVQEDYYFKRTEFISYAAVMLVSCIFFLVNQRRYFLKNNLTELLIPFFIYLYTIFLLNSNPVKSPVLLIWFLPALFSISVPIVRILNELLRRKNKNAFSIFYVLLIVFVNISVSYDLHNKSVINDSNIEKLDTMKQIESFAVYIDSEVDPKDRIFILANFAYREKDIPAFADSINAVLQEKLNKKYNISSGEFVTFEKDKVFDFFKRMSKEYDTLFLILERESDQFEPKYYVNYYTREIFIKINRFADCFDPITEDISVQKHGDRKILRYRKEGQCENIFKDL